MVIPSINCPDFETAANQIRKSKEFSGWIHIDVSDGKFAAPPSWGDAAEFKSIKTSQNFEVNLMVENPEEAAVVWLEAGAKRIIVPIQAMRDPAHLKSLASRYNANVMLSLDPSQSIEKIVPYIKDFEFVHILNVVPGPSGQEKQIGWVEKTKSLRALSPTATIEVDGGIDLESARIAKDAGADILVAGSYIFSSPDPKGAYERLTSI